MPLYANIQARARLAKAQADSRTLATAVAIYGARMGTLPTALTQLTSVATNSQGGRSGPFMASISQRPLRLGRLCLYADRERGHLPDHQLRRRHLGQRAVAGSPSS